MDNPQDEWLINHEKRKMEQDTLATQFKKDKFIREMKSGLGDLIKEEPNKEQKKLTWFQKLKKMF